MTRSFVPVVPSFSRPPISRSVKDGTETGTSSGTGTATKTGSRGPISVEFPGGKVTGTVTPTGSSASKTTAKSTSGGKSSTGSKLSTGSGTKTNGKTTSPAKTSTGSKSTATDGTKSSSSSASESSEECNPNRKDNEGGGGSSNPLFDLPMPPQGGVLKGAAKAIMGLFGYDEDTGKEDERPACPTETATEDEDEEKEDGDDIDPPHGKPPGISDGEDGGIDIGPPPGGDDDDDDNVLPPGGGSNPKPKPGSDPKPPKPGSDSDPKPKPGSDPKPPKPGSDSDPKPKPGSGSNPKPKPGPGPGPGPGPDPFSFPRPLPGPGGSGPKKTPAPGQDPKNTPQPTPNPSPTATPPPTVDGEDCAEVVFNAGCVQDCTSFSYTKANLTSTWTECGGEECSLDTGCVPTPAMTETSWTTRTCSRTITQTDVCKQACTEYVSPLASTTSAYTTETKCASTVTCRPTVVCEEQDTTTTTSYTTTTEAPTQACYATEEDLEASLEKLREELSHPSDDNNSNNTTALVAKQKRDLPDGYTLLQWDRLTHPWDLRNEARWFGAWQRELMAKGVGSPAMAALQVKDDDFLPNHAIYLPFGFLPGATGIPSMKGCSAVVVASPQGVYVAYFYEIPTFAPPDEATVNTPLRFDYTDRAKTWRQRVTDFLLHGNLRFKNDEETWFAPDPNNPASPSLRDLASGPDGPFYALKEQEWHFIAFMSPRGSRTDEGQVFYKYPEAHVEWRDEIRAILSPGMDNPKYLPMEHRNRGASVKDFFYSVERDYSTPKKNSLIVQYAPAVPHPEQHWALPNQQVRIWWNGKPILEKTWCMDPIDMGRALPPNLPNNNHIIPVTWLLPDPGPMRLAARQEDNNNDISTASDLKPTACAARPWKVCAVDIAQTVIPTMNPSIQGTIDVTDELGLRAHIEDFKDVPFGGFVNSEPADNNLGYNLTMRFDGDWDRYLLDKGYACNCTDDGGCDLYSAQCCRRGDCPTCDCPGGECAAGSPACCADNSCNATRPADMKDYPFKAWDVKVFIEGEKGALGDEHVWAKNVSCTAGKWDYLNETVVDGYCLPVSFLTAEIRKGGFS